VESRPIVVVGTSTINVVGPSRKNPKGLPQPEDEVEVFDFP